MEQFQSLDEGFGSRKSLDTKVQVGPAIGPYSAAEGRDNISPSHGSHVTASPRRLDTVKQDSEAYRSNRVQRFDGI